MPSGVLDTTKHTVYTTPADVLDLTGDEVGQAHCIAATAIIKNYTGMHFDKGNSVTNKVYSGDGGHWLDLGYYPIIAVSSVTMNDTPITNYDTPDEHGNADGYLYRETGWNEGVANIKVSFSYGYSTVPQIVKTIATRIAALLKNERLDNVLREQLGEYTVSFVYDRTTQDLIDRLLVDLPKSSDIFAQGQDSVSQILSMTETLIHEGD